LDGKGEEKKRSGVINRIGGLWQDPAKGRKIGALEIQNEGLLGVDVLGQCFPLLQSHLTTERFCCPGL
jgi:hypothetical protein